MAGRRRGRGRTLEESARCRPELLRTSGAQPLAMSRCARGTAAVSSMRALRRRARRATWRSSLTIASFSRRFFS